MAAANKAPPNRAAERHDDDNEALRVLVVSSIRLFQEAFATLMERQDGITIVGATSPPQASAIVDELRPDIVLLDATRQRDLDCAKTLSERQPTPKVVAFGITESDAEIVSLAEAGISGYVHRDAAAADVAAVLASTMRGELLCSPRAAATLCQHVALLSRNDRAGALPGALSKRELQIAGLIDRGLSNKEIARRLGIQAATVKNHVHNILDKLKVHRRGEAAACLRVISPTRSPTFGASASSD